jgi:hypothetical protein
MTLGPYGSSGMPTHLVSIGNVLRNSVGLSDYGEAFRCRVVNKRLMTNFPGLHRPPGPSRRAIGSEAGQPMAEHLATVDDCISYPPEMQERSDSDQGVWRGVARAAAREAARLK